MSPEDRTTTEEQLSAYLDGQLDPPERAALEQRLEGDTDLRRTLAELESTVRMVGGLPAEPSPPGLREDTLAMLERDMLLDQSSDEPIMLPDRPRRAWRWLATAAVVTMASTAGYFTLQQVRTGAIDSNLGATQVAMNQQPQAPALPLKGGRGQTLDRPSDAKSELDRGDARRGRSAAFNAAVTADEADDADASATLNALNATKPSSPTPPPPAQNRPAQADVQVAKPTPPPAPVAQFPYDAVSATDEALSAEGKEAEESVDANEGASLADRVLRLHFDVSTVAPKEVRLAVQASRPAHVYAMLARTRSFAANERMRLIDAPSTERKPTRRRMAGTTARKGGAGQERASAGARRRQITLLARRSQLVGLLGELQRQDGEASVQMKIGESSSVGWEQVLAAAGRVGSVEMELPARAKDFAGLTISLGEATLQEESEERHEAGTRENAQTQAKEKARAEFPEPQDFVDKRMVQGVVAGGTLDAVPKSQPVMGATAQPMAALPAQRAGGATWAVNLMRLLRQADAAIDPDPVVRIYLTVTIPPVADTPRPERFEDAPEMGLAPHGQQK